MTYQEAVKLLPPARLAHAPTLLRVLRLLGLAKPKPKKENQ